MVAQKERYCTLNKKSNYPDILHSWVNYIFLCSDVRYSFSNYWMPWCLQKAKLENVTAKNFIGGNSANFIAVPFNAKIHNSITDGLTDAKGSFNDINYAQVLFLN